MSNVAAIILAAGEGTRINAKNINKVLYPIANKPMLGYTFDLAINLKLSPIVVVIGFKKKQIKSYIKDDCIFVDQGKLLGTGHAVKRAVRAIPNSCKEVIVLYGDHSAFFKAIMIKQLIQKHRKSKAVMTFISVDRKNPTGYGRVLRTSFGKISGIREEKNASPQEKKIKEINTGTYCFSTKFLNDYLLKIRKNPEKGEYLLTDLAEIAIRDNLVVQAYKVDDELVSLGVNTLKELKEVDKLMRKTKRLNFNIIDLD